MTTNNGHSVAELRRESERTRAELAQTVATLRSEITETAAGVRRTISPDNIKAEVSGYVADKGRSWLAALKQQAMDHPMQTLALAVPVVRMAKGIPLPLLMIGAGLALASPRVRNTVADKIADTTGVSPGEVIERVREVASDKLRTATATTEGAADQATQAAQNARSAAGSAMAKASETATQLSSDVKERVAVGRDLVSEKLSAASTTAGEAIEAARAKSAEKLSVMRDQAGTVVRDNALLVGGIGLAIGALLAASLPATRLEQKTIGETSDNLRRKAADAAEETFGRVKSAAMSATDDMQAEVAKGIDRFADAATEKLKTVTDEAVTTAFEPTPSHR